MDARRLIFTDSGVIGTDFFSFWGGVDGEAVPPTLSLPFLLSVDASEEGAGDLPNVLGDPACGLRLTCRLFFQGIF